MRLCRIWTVNTELSSTCHPLTFIDNHAVSAKTEFFIRAYSIKISAFKVAQYKNNNNNIIIIIIIASCNNQCMKNYGFKHHPEECHGSEMISRHPNNYVSLSQCGCSSISMNTTRLGGSRHGLLKWREHCNEKMSQKGAHTPSQRTVMHSKSPNWIHMLSYNLNFSWNFMFLPQMIHHLWRTEYVQHVDLLNVTRDPFNPLDAGRRYTGFSQTSKRRQTPVYRVCANFPTSPDPGIPGLRKLINPARHRYTGFIF